MTVTLVALPPKEIAESLTGLSARIGEAISSEYILGDMAYPHVTLVQWESNVPDRILESLKDVPWQPGSVTLAGLALVPGPDGEVWLEVPALSSTWLRGCQERALDRTTGLGSVVNGIGDNFRPHATVGLTVADALDLDGFVSFELLRSTTSGWRVAFGESGENYVLKRIALELSR